MVHVSFDRIASPGELVWQQPDLESPRQLLLSAAFACLFISSLHNLACTWQTPMWELAILRSQVSDGRSMMSDIEVTS